MRVSADIRAVDVQLRQVENLAVRVLAGGHDARDHVRGIHIIGDAGEVFALPDLHVGIHAHAFDQKHIEPVPGQFRAVFVHQPAFAQQGVHRIDVFKAHVLRRGGQVGIKGEAVPGQAGGRYALSHRRADDGGRWLKFADHVVQQVVEDVACVDRDPGEVRYDTVDAEGLVTQLTWLDYLVLKADVHLRALLFRSRVGQVLGGHIAVPTVRAGDLVPGGRRLADQDNLRAFFVFGEDLIVGARAGAQAQRIPLGGHGVDLHVVGLRLVLLRHQIHLRRHGGGHGRTQNVALAQPRPFSVLVDGMHERQLPLAIERFGHRAGLRLHHAQTVAREVGAVGGIDTNQGFSPPRGIEKAPPVRVTLPGRKRAPFTHDGRFPSTILRFFQSKRYLIPRMGFESFLLRSCTVSDLLERTRLPQHPDKIQYGSLRPQNERYCGLSSKWACSMRCAPPHPATHFEGRSASGTDPRACFHPAL